MTPLATSARLLTGRTALYRGAAVRDEAFLQAFTHDYWLGRYLLDSGDDCFLTQWMQAQGWEIRFQSAPEAAVLSTANETWGFTKQCVRWQRNTLRMSVRTVLYIPRLLRYPALSHQDPFKDANAYLENRKPRIAKRTFFNILRPVQGALKFWNMILFLADLQPQSPSQ